MNYSEMSDGELRLAIARARGWIFVDEAAFVGVPDNGGLSAFQPCPNYATDLNAAFELVEEMRKEKNIVFVMLEAWSYSHRYKAIVQYYKGDGSQAGFGLEAATPARAIAEAWLAWREAKQQQEQGG
jgi:hypothetical protein